MSNNTVTVPAMDEPLFRGHPTLLIWTAIILGCLCILCSHRKPVISRPDGTQISGAELFYMHCALEIISVVLSIMLYTRDGPALMTSMPASGVYSEPINSEARILLLLIFIASASAFMSQLVLVGVYFQVSGSRGVRMGVALLSLATTAFGWVTGSWISFGKLWRTHTFLEEVEWMKMGLVFLVTFDTLLWVALLHLHRQASDSRKPLLAKLLPMAWNTFTMGVTFMNLPVLPHLFGVPRNGWLDNNLSILGILITGHMHFITLFQVTKAVAENAESEATLAESPVDLSPRSNLAQLLANV
ncbi:hypothetical protein PsYK624_040680 [Phanerochaete sordida]|uniref:Uncharacterized protein n=1 Tax=Phanerochaete sordida TaxID=48140 RepID=A0A9P3LAB0_9APHY|nr:hypothetical protein PsYK624_040680 [Phanerochaete sordida]